MSERKNYLISMTHLLFWMMPGQWATAGIIPQAARLFFWKEAGRYL